MPPEVTDAAGDGAGGSGGISSRPRRFVQI